LKSLSAYDDDWHDCVILRGDKMYWATKSAA
jgi:hypothetical protein